MAPRTTTQTKDSSDQSLAVDILRPLSIRLNSKWPGVLYLSSVAVMMLSILLLIGHVARLYAMPGGVSIAVYIVGVAILFLIISVKNIRSIKKSIVKAIGETGIPRSVLYEVAAKQLDYVKLLPWIDSERFARASILESLLGLEDFCRVFFDVMYFADKKASSADAVAWANAWIAAGFLFVSETQHYVRILGVTGISKEVNLTWQDCAVSARKRAEMAASSCAKQTKDSAFMSLLTTIVDRARSAELIPRVEAQQLVDYKEFDYSGGYATSGVQYRNDEWAVFHVKDPEKTSAFLTFVRALPGSGLLFEA